MTIKSPPPAWMLRSLDMRANLRHNRCAERDIRNEMAVHLRRFESSKNISPQSLSRIILFSVLEYPALPVLSSRLQDAIFKEIPPTISTCSQSQPSPIVFEHSWPSCAKSALRIEGAMIAGGLIMKTRKEIDGRGFAGRRGAGLDGLKGVRV
jgi:hypothetical protein